MISQHALVVYVIVEGALIIFSFENMKRDDAAISNFVDMTMADSIISQRGERHCIVRCLDAAPFLPKGLVNDIKAITRAAAFTFWLSEMTFIVKK
ncbi:hypothetical protein AMJ52_08025 [candidate division TA06 bacterium DG_78]|uniref:Uncharacterized protein n=1 Tax=candidate division TA06 bacterium DG_78 TaxID=1703772 RepID=A0A0S7YBD7_UNCT6|nr:MAG: hypothetical protein AMJ52_08025 [candidate division TA06 bacterium DG_78]